MPTSEAFCMDCVEGMRKLPDKCFTLAVCDPPYGINVAQFDMGAGTGKRCSKIENRQWTPKDWDSSPPTDEWFSQLFRVSENQIIFGGNYFYLPPCKCFLIWDKGDGMYGRSFSECEFAWTSLSDTARIFKYSPVDKNRFHPTQKPVALYAWIFNRYAKPGMKILDTHLGSGSSRIAAYDAGLDFVGYEIDETYFRLQEERFARHTAQMSLFE